MQTGTFESTVGEDDIAVVVQWNGWYTESHAFGSADSAYPSEGELRLVSIEAADGSTLKQSDVEASRTRLLVEAWEDLHANR